jgi:hypothetical protein
LFEALTSDNNAVRYIQSQLNASPQLQGHADFRHRVTHEHSIIVINKDALPYPLKVSDKEPYVVPVSAEARYNDSMTRRQLLWGNCIYGSPRAANGSHRNDNPIVSGSIKAGGNP